MLQPQLWHGFDSVTSRLPEPLFPSLCCGYRGKERGWEGRRLPLTSPKCSHEGSPSPPVPLCVQQCQAEGELGEAALRAPRQHACCHQGPLPCPRPGWHPVHCFSPKNGWNSALKRDLSYQSVTWGAHLRPIQEQRRAPGFPRHASYSSQLLWKAPGKRLPWQQQGARPQQARITPPAPCRSPAAAKVRLCRAFIARRRQPL